MMRFIIKLFSAILLLATMYMIVADGMIGHFNLTRAEQYVFNLSAIFAIIPFGLYLLLGLYEEESI